MPLGSLITRYRYASPRHSPFCLILHQPPYPAFFIGCLISNILTGCILPDIIFGSLATLIGALGTYALRKWKWCAPLTPILANILVVPLVLIYGYGFLIEGVSLLSCYFYYVLTVGAGEIISCGILGMFLLFTLEKYAGRIFPRTS